MKYLKYVRYLVLALVVFLLTGRRAKASEVVLPTGTLTLLKPDEVRQQELCDKFKKSLGWPDHDVEFRIAEKERDAEIQIQKASGCLDNLLLNTSLLAVSNEKLKELYLKLNEVEALIETELRSR
jgi:hypothetical protein